METHELQFLYKGGDTYHFMNTENYEQLEMDARRSATTRSGCRTT
jgi:translation elongation factor P/translation initiation factor 5A